MSLRKTVIFTIVITFIGLFALLIINLRTILSDYFYLQERNSIIYDLQRSQSAIQSEIDTFHALMTDWVKASGASPSSEPNLQNLQSQLSKTTLETLRVAFATAFDLTGVQLFTNTLLPTQVDLSQGDSLNNLLGQPDQSMTGLYLTPSGSFLLDRQVIKDVQGTTRAVIIFGRSVDPARVGGSAQFPGLQPRLLSAQDPTVPQEVTGALARSAGNPQPYIQIQDQDVIIGYAVQKNMLGQPNIILKLTEPRSVYRNGQLMINYLILFLVLASIIFSIIMLLLMERLIVSRLLKLGSEVNQITVSGDPSARVTVNRQDELSRLSLNINSLLESVQSSAKAQAESLQVLSQLEHNLREQVNRLETLHLISRSFLPQSDAPVTMTEITRQSVEKMGFDSALLMSAKPHQAILRIFAQSGAIQFTPGDDTLQRLISEFWRTGESSYVVINPGRSLPQNYRAAAIHLLYESENEVYLLCVLSKETLYFSEQKEFLQAFVNLAEIKLQSAFLYEAVRNGRETLSALSHRLVQIQEEERRWIAQELHDEIGQSLTGLKLTIDSTAHQSLAQAKETLVQAQAIVNDLIGRVRQISLDLRPAMLDDLGLLPSLLWLFERYQQQTGIEIDFSHHNIEGLRFPSEHETAVYRVIQEALTNAARHAKTDRVSIQVWSVDSTINARIEDRGEGFDLPSVLSSPKTRGLLGIRERIAFLRGKLTIDTSPGQGTCLTIELPLTDYPSIAELPYDHQDSPG